jgi:SAM-dependent methyltransferase
MVARSHSFGEQHPPSIVDRFGIWLSAKAIRRQTGSLRGKRIGDFGCGYRATLSRSLVAESTSVLAVDVSLDPALRDIPKLEAIEGRLPGALATIPDGSLDVVLCVSVLEHLDSPEATLKEFRRLLKPGGVCVINVPSWLGKRFLEFAAFRLGLSPADEMDDHRRYYDPRDLWPLLVDAGFKPRNIHCFRHKFGLNTLARCSAPLPETTLS